MCNEAYDMHRQLLSFTGSLHPFTLPSQTCELQKKSHRLVPVGAQSGGKFLRVKD
jgi:hypothetical protein